MNDFTEIVYAVPDCNPVSEHVRGVTVVGTVHVWDPPLTLASKDVSRESDP